MRKVQRAIAVCQKIGKEEPSVTDTKENPNLVSEEYMKTQRNRAIWIRHYLQGLPAENSFYWTGFTLSYQVEKQCKWYLSPEGPGERSRAQKGTDSRLVTHAPCSAWPELSSSSPGSCGAVLWVANVSLGAEAAGSLCCPVEIQRTLATCKISNFLEATWKK